MSSQDNQLYEFGPYVIDARSRILLKDGTTVTGRLLGHDTFSVQLLDSKEQLRSFAKGDLREHGFVASPMPSYRGTLSPQEIADMVSYLSSLRGQ